MKDLIFSYLLRTGVQPIWKIVSMLELVYPDVTELEVINLMLPDPDFSISKEGWNITQR